MDFDITMFTQYLEEPQRVEEDPVEENPMEEDPEEDPMEEDLDEETEEDVYEDTDSADGEDEFESNLLDEDMIADMFEVLSIETSGEFHYDIDLEGSVGSASTRGSVVMDERDDKRLFEVIICELETPHLQAMEGIWFWLLLENIGVVNVISNIWALSMSTMKMVVDETEEVLHYLKAQYTPTLTIEDFPQLYHVTGECLSLNLLYIQRREVIEGTQTIVGKCFHHFRSILEAIARDKKSPENSITYRGWSR
ncbi:hypothetical protein PIB30_009216 [Stylosanthes scabra]|uniref:Uncharacterized protein n=1 Tax=Stylosanthes scabra TaxID=79078 RepID=A0ABU6Q500_9FABA|nr:hypothetical protein [Stylosanthes scabra]